MIQELQTVSEEEVKKWDKEYLQSKFLELQEIAKDGNIIIQKQQYLLDLREKEIENSKKELKSSVSKNRLNDYILKELKMIEKNKTINRNILDGMKAVYLGIKNIFLEDK